MKKKEMAISFDGDATKLKDYIVDKYPMRRNKHHKKVFRNWLKAYAEDRGYREKETILFDDYCTKTCSSNIIIGDLEKSNIILTAHYDTSFNQIVPIPKKTCFLIMAIAGYMVSLLVLCYLFINYLLPNKIVFYSCILFILIYLIGVKRVKGIFSNKNNYNDNTSGVLTLMYIMDELTKDKYKEKHDNVSFVFFDQEEMSCLKSKRGSTAFKEEYDIQDKLLLNFDCVGDGDTLYFVTEGKENFFNPKILTNTENGMDIFKKIMIGSIKNSKLDLTEESKYHKYRDCDGLKFYQFKKQGDLKYIFSSDHNNFIENGIGVKVASLNNIYHGSNRYHTCRDKKLDVKNIEMLSKIMIEFINDMSIN